MKFSLAEMRRALAPVFAVEEKKSFAGSLPSADAAATAPGEGKSALLRETVARLEHAGMDVLVADLSAPGSGVCAVKMIVPGLEVETMSYRRIGERNVARLLARAREDAGFPVLAGLGTPPPGAAAVVVTREACSRLGATPWLDTRKLDASMRDLYVLYREPSRHVTALSMHEPARIQVTSPTG